LTPARREAIICGVVQGRTVVQFDVEGVNQQGQ
jgi:hypothetical protein